MIFLKDLYGIFSGNPKVILIGDNGKVKKINKLDSIASDDNYKEYEVDCIAKADKNNYQAEYNIYICDAEPIPEHEKVYILKKGPRN